MRPSRLTALAAIATVAAAFVISYTFAQHRPSAARRPRSEVRVKRQPHPPVPRRQHERPLWAARLAPDRRTLNLTYQGQTWVTGLRVEVVAGDPKLGSTAPGARLVAITPRRPGETVFRVRAPVPYEIVFDSEDSALGVSLRGFAPQSQAQAVIAAEIHAGPDPIQARLDSPRDDVWQMESGRATSTLNDSVYDRSRDQALRVLARETQFTTTSAGFRVTAAGPLGEAPRCRFELLDRVYSNRLPYFTPLDKKKWPHAPVGWCSWYKYFSHVTEKDILRNADALATYYKSFGLEYCLIDAGWQHAGNGENGAPVSGNWDASNLKFPDGMKWMADQIHARGLKAALWLSVFGNADKDFYERHPAWFLHDENGNARLGSWFGTYVADFSNPQLKQHLYDVYRRHTLEWGYDYFKLDGENDTRDLWARNRVRAYDPTLDANTAFRQALRLIRQAMDSKPGVFFSACGPIYPTESMGIAQSARLGDDVVGDKEPPSFRGVRAALEGMRRGYYTHNIAWYTDPDVLVLRPPLTASEARTWTSVLGLSGQLLMLGDDMAALPTDRREMLRKIIPVADITPMDLFPITRDRPIWMLHVARPFGAWDVAGLFNWEAGADEIPPSIQSDAFRILGQDDSLLGAHREWGEQLEVSSGVKKAQAENGRLQTLGQKPAGLMLLPVPAYLAPPAPRKIVLDFAKAGFDPSRDYLLFDFWNQKFLGKVHGQYSVKLKPHHCEVISLRPAENHPQLIGTDRHITMGGVEIKDERWDAARKQLRIAVDLVENYPTTLTFYTAGDHLRQASVAGATLKTSTHGEIARTSVWSKTSGPRQVILQFE